MVKFQISTRWTERKRIIQVYVYDTVKELREAATKYDEWVGNAYTSFNNTHAITTSFQTEKIINGEWQKTPKAGLIRFYKGGLWAGVISHEATHMAVSIYGDDWLEKHGEPYEDMDNQEILAYLVGDITSKIVSKCYEKNLL